MRRSLSFLTPIFFLLAVLSGCKEKPPEITVVDAWARETPLGAPNGAIYLTLRNSGGSPDELVEVSTDAATKAEAHTHMHEGVVMRMRPMVALGIPPGKDTILKPGGDHIMLIGLSGRLTAGEQITLHLSFEKSPDQTVKVPILPIGQTP